MLKMLARPTGYNKRRRSYPCGFTFLSWKPYCFRSTHKYWQITAADNIYPEPYASHKVINYSNIYPHLKLKWQTYRMFGHKYHRYQNVSRCIVACFFLNARQNTFFGVSYILLCCIRRATLKSDDNVSK